MTRLPLSSSSRRPHAGRSGRRKALVSSIQLGPVSDPAHRASPWLLSWVPHRPPPYITAPRYPRLLRRIRRRTSLPHGKASFFPPFFVNFACFLRHYLSKPLKPRC